jgi:hypothetical protein
VSFAAITLCVASQRVFIIVVAYSVMTQSGNFWIHPRMYSHLYNLTAAAATVKISEYSGYALSKDYI